MNKPTLYELDELLDLHVLNQPAREAIRHRIGNLRRRELTWKVMATGLAVVLIAAFQRWI